MEEDRADPSQKEESVYDFVRRNIARDRAAEAEARKALVSRLVGRVIKTDLTTRPGSVIAPRKGRPPSREKVDAEDAVTKRVPDKPKAPVKKVQEETRQRTKPPEPPKKEMPRIVSEQVENERPVTSVVKAKAIEARTDPPVPALSGKRTTSERKLRALTEVACGYGTPRNLKAVDLITETARKLRTPVTAVRTYWARSLTRAQKDLLLYGEGGKKVTRADEKFAILMRVRAEMREKKEPKPRKKELAIAAAGPLGMTLDSTNTYIYDRLTSEQVKLLDLQGQFLTHEEQVAILQRIRKEMRDKGLPKPRQVDLAKAAASELRQKVHSVRALIVTLSDAEKDELEFSDTRAGTFVGLDPATIRAGFLGAINVLKLRKLPVTFDNLRLILRMKPALIREYLSEHPEIASLLDAKKRT